MTIENVFSYTVLTLTTDPTTLLWNIETSFYFDFQCKEKKSMKYSLEFIKKKN